MESSAESDCFRSRSNTWPKNSVLDSSQSSSIGRKYIYGNQTYADLIEKSIEASPERRLALSEIYQWLVDNVPHFKDKTVSPLSWKNSVRHNLSLHGKFLRVQVDRKSLWTINPNPGEANNGRRKVRRGGKSSKRQTTCEHTQNYNSRSQCMNEVVFQQVRTLRRNPPGQNQERQYTMGSYSPAEGQLTQGRKYIEPNIPLTMNCQQSPLSKPMEPLTDYMFPENIKEEYTNADYNFRTRSYSSSSSVSRSSLASSVDEATASIDWTGSRMSSMAAYFSTFKAKSDITQQETNSFARTGHNLMQLPTNLHTKIGPMRTKAEYEDSENNFRFRQRSCSYSNEGHSKYNALGAAKSRPPGFYIKHDPKSKHLLEHSEPFRQRSYSNPNSRLNTSQQYGNVSKPDRMSNLNIMQTVRSRSNSNPMTKPTTCLTRKNMHSSVAEIMSPMMERLRFESSDQVQHSDLSSINVEPLNFQENLDIGNIIKHELSIDGVLDFS
nr:unnamed protein product [Callosobruchus analis]